MTSTLRWLLLALWVCPAVTIPAAVMAQDDAIDEAETIFAAENPIEIEQPSPDADIAERISGIIEATGWYQSVSVTVDEGVVFLDGETSTDTRKNWARQLASKTSGVVAVVNRITVKEEVSWSFDPALQELSNLARQGITLLPLLVLALLVLPLAWFAARLVSKVAKIGLKSRIQSPFLRTVVARAIAFPVFLIGLYIVLQVAGMTQLAISLVGGAGVLGIVIGFAFRDIAENFLSSLILSVRRPFRRGDYVEVAGIAGTVRSMNTRSTIIASVEGNLIHVPNSTIFKNVIENFTSSPERRGEFVVGIGYDATVSDAQRIILDGLKAHRAVLSDPEPMVLVDELGASTINIRTYYWFDGHQISSIKLKSSLLRMVNDNLNAAGISMPDEAREVIFPQGVEVFTSPRKDEIPSDPKDLAIEKSPKPEPDQTESEGDLLSELPTPLVSDGGLEDDDDDLLGAAKA